MRMGGALFEFDIQTPHEGMVDITETVRQAVRQSNLEEGIAVVYSPHTTAGITINENADPHVVRDLVYALDKAFPDRPEFLHAEGNSAAHLKAMAVGSSVTVIVDGGKLVLGIWQGIYFCEFDGPRRRRFHVKVIKG